MRGQKLIVTALSGGVDSGVSASLLLDAGNSVEGLFMRHRYQKTVSENETFSVLKEIPDKSLLSVLKLDTKGTLSEFDWTPEDFPFSLPTDAVSAINVATFLGIKLRLLDVDKVFAPVVENFVDEYFAARTPNPCVLCNRTVKFAALLDVARSLGADGFATGHYVRKPSAKEWFDRDSAWNREVNEYFNFGLNRDFDVIPDWLSPNDERAFWTRALSSKDQTYFLCGVDAEALAFVEFPVGRFSKEQTREIASQKGLPVAKRKDSQEICFVPDKGCLEFVRNVRDLNPARWANVPRDTGGAFLSLDGKRIGSHDGYEKLTIGQRKGLGAGFGERIFVQRVVPETRDVVLGPYEALAVDKIFAVDSNWHCDVPIGDEFRCEIKIRYRNESCPATVRVFNDGSVEAIPDSPRYGVAPGQALVCYWRDRLLGGGRIVRP